MIPVFEDLQSEIELFFNDLNWTYILMYVFVLYGVKHKEEFDWYNHLFDGSKYKSFKVWVAGLIIAFLFCVFKFLEGGLTFSLMVSYISRVLRSWMVVIVFNSIFSDKISKIDKKEQQ